MREFLIWLFSGLVPPHDADPNRLYRWRVTMAMVTMSNSLAVAGLSVLCFGVVPVVFGGFAPTKSMNDLGATVSDVRHGQLDDKIIATRARQCEVIASKNQEALLFATARLQTELEAYQRLTRTPYRLPGCDEL